MKLSIDDIKALILFAKEQKVRHVKVGDVEFTMALVGLYPPELPDTSTNTEGKSTLNPTGANPSDLPIEDDPDLFHSAD